MCLNYVRQSKNIDAMQKEKREMDAMHGLSTHNNGVWFLIKESECNLPDDYLSIENAIFSM